MSQDDADLTNRSVRHLLSLWAAILRELRRRKIVRTANNPIGDIAEALVAEHFDGKRPSFSNPGWDVMTPEGELLEVKSIRFDEVSTRSNLSPISKKATYSKVIIVVFDKDLRVSEALEASRAAVEELFKPRKKDGARVIRLTQLLRQHSEVRSFELSDALLDR